MATVKMTVGLDPCLYRDLKFRVFNEGTTIQKLVDAALRKYFEPVAKNSFVGDPAAEVKGCVERIVRNRGDNLVFMQAFAEYLAAMEDLAKRVRERAASSAPVAAP